MRTEESRRGVAEGAFPLTGEALLTLLQLADSAFPTGMYAHSHGLEGVVSRGLVNTANDVEALLRAQLTFSLLPSDGVALLSAHRLPHEAIEIDRLLLAMKLPAELRAASCQTGRRLLAETATLLTFRSGGPAACPPPPDCHVAPSSTSTPPAPRNDRRRAFTGNGALQEYRDAVSARRAPGNAAVALGLITAALQIPAEAALLAACHSFLLSALGAAMRLLPLTHSDAQAVLHRLHPQIGKQLPALHATHWRDMTAFTPQLDLIAVAHEQDDLRLFAS